jgi:hypothetical protein
MPKHNEKILNQLWPGAISQAVIFDSAKPIQCFGSMVFMFSEWRLQRVPVGPLSAVGMSRLALRQPTSDLQTSLLKLKKTWQNRMLPRREKECVELPA